MDIYFCGWRGYDVGSCAEHACVRDCQPAGKVIDLAPVAGLNVRTRVCLVWILCLLRVWMDTVIPSHFSPPSIFDFSPPSIFDFSNPRLQPTDGRAIATFIFHSLLLFMS